MATTPFVKRLKSSKSSTRKFWHIEDTTTLEELDERVGHIQRVTDGLSDPKLGTAPPAEIFSSAYSHFANVYRREELRELEREFLQADLDGDGKLNRQEMKYWMEKHIEPITESQAKSLMDRFDPDKDDTLDFKEFVALCTNIGYKKSKTVALNVKKAFQTSPNAHTQIDESAQNSSSKSPSCGLAPCNIATTSRSKDSSHRSLKSSRSQDDALHVDNSKANASRNKARHVDSSRSCSSKRGNVKQIINCFEKKIHKLMQEAAASRNANDTLARRARTKPKNPVGEAAMLHATAADAIQQSEIDETKPPVPPPMPQSPLFEVAKPLKSTATENQDKLKSSSSSTTTGPQPWPLHSSGNSQQPHSSENKAGEQVTSNKPKDKLDEFQILKKSNESSRSGLSRTIPVEMAKEAREQPDKHERRFSEPSSSSTSKDTPGASYGEERIMAEFGPVAISDESKLQDMKNMKQSYESPLDAVFEKGPRGLNQNYFVFPNVYKGGFARQR